MFPFIRTVSFCSAKINKITWFTFKHFEKRILFTFHGSTDVTPILCDEKQHAHITFCLPERLVFVEKKDCFSRLCLLIKTSDDRRESPRACVVRQPLTSSSFRCQILNSLLACSEYVFVNVPLILFNVYIFFINAIIDFLYCDFGLR